MLQTFAAACTLANAILKLALHYESVCSQSLTLHSSAQSLHQPSVLSLVAAGSSKGIVLPTSATAFDFSFFSFAALLQPPATNKSFLSATPDGKSNMTYGCAPTRTGTQQQCKHICVAARKHLQNHTHMHDFMSACLLCLVPSMCLLCLDPFALRGTIT